MDEDILMSIEEIERLAEAALTLSLGALVLIGLYFTMVDDKEK